MKILDCCLCDLCYRKIITDKDTTLSNVISLFYKSKTKCVELTINSYKIYLCKYHVEKILQSFDDETILNSLSSYSLNHP